MQRKSNETKYFISFHLIQNQSKYHRLTFNAKLNEKRDRIIETQTTISYLNLKNKPAFYLRFITDDFKSGHLINRRREREKEKKANLQGAFGYRQGNVKRCQATDSQSHFGAKEQSVLSTLEES